MMIVDDRHDDVEVRRNGEVATGLANTSQVSEDQDQDDEDGQQQACRFSISGKCLVSAGKAVVSAAVPAEHCTATVTV